VPIGSTNTNCYAVFRCKLYYSRESATKLRGNSDLAPAAPCVLRDCNAPQRTTKNDKEPLRTTRAFKCVHRAMLDSYSRVMRARLRYSLAWAEKLWGAVFAALLRTLCALRMAGYSGLFFLLRLPFFPRIN
jgi:hypothetical protein